MQLLDRQIEEKQNDQQRLRAQIASYQTRVDGAPTRESEMTELTRDYQTFRTCTEPALEERGIDDCCQSRTPADRRAVQAARPARVAEKPYSPNRPR
jgi:uncharacterized protein involved in exopolysaccharide biosynthesis